MINLKVAESGRAYKLLEKISLPQQLANSLLTYVRLKHFAMTARIFAPAAKESG